MAGAMGSLMRCEPQTKGDDDKMRIRDLVWKDKGRAGSAGAWRVETDDNRRRTIWHYSTAMLSFDVCADGSPDLDSIDYSIGHGNVSDQMAMNAMFRAINAPFYFILQGGARIEYNPIPRVNSIA